jgi:coenzyme F420 hydrogenase subunit beta
MPENISQALKRKICNGCGACAGVCPSEAIEMKRNNDGTNEAIINGQCGNCGLCHNVCPVLNEVENFWSENEEMLSDGYIGSYSVLYTGYSADQEIRKRGSSGGIATSLLLELFRSGRINGAVSVEQEDGDLLRSRMFIARSEDEIINSSGSRYAPVSMEKALKTILKSEGKFAFVGLPCHMWGIRRAEKYNPRLKEKIVLHIGLFCSKMITKDGVVSVLQKSGAQGGKIMRLAYRGPQWPGGLNAEFEDGRKVYIPNQASVWSDIFGSFLFTPRYCAFCDDDMNEMSDISIGDAWIKRIIENDKCGTSLIVTRSDIAKELIKKMEMDGKVFLNSVDKGEVIVSQKWPLAFKKKNIFARINIFRILKLEFPDNLKHDNVGSKVLLRDYIIAFLILFNLQFSATNFGKKIIKLIPGVIIKKYRNKISSLLKM